MFNLLFIARALGAIGLLCISAGVMNSDNVRRQDGLFIGGGIALLVYSISLKDPIFIPLQIIFVAAALWNLYKKSDK